MPAKKSGGKYPILPAALNSPRKRSTTHPWNRGFTNRTKLADMLRKKKWDTSI